MIDAVFEQEVEHSIRLSLGGAAERRCPKERHCTHVACASKWAFLNHAGSFPVLGTRDDSWDPPSAIPGAPATGCNPLLASVEACLPARGAIRPSSPTAEGGTPAQTPLEARQW